MGAGSAASENILFIGALVIATGVVGAFAGVVSGLTEGMDAHGEGLSKALRTDIAVINDPEHMVVSPLTIYVKNLGSTILHPSLTDLLLDGQPSANLTFDVLGSLDDEVWRPAEVLKIEVNDLTVNPGDHGVRVVAESGVEARFTFRSV